MLKIYFGSPENEIYDTSVYFDHQYEDEWITSDLARNIVRDVDKSEVVGAHLIESPFLGPISPKQLSGGTKTLLLMAYDKSGKIFNASAGGDNCAGWILEIAKDKDLTIALHHCMDFGKKNMEAEILNNGQIIHSDCEYLRAAIEFLK